MGEIPPNHGPRPDYPKSKTVVDLLREHARETPLSHALVVPEGENSDGVRLTVTYAEMYAAVTRGARDILAAISATHSLDSKRKSANAHAGWPEPHELTMMLDPSITVDHWIILVLPQGLAQVCLDSQHQL